MASVRHRRPAVLALLAAAWAVFLLPAQHVAWEALPEHPAPGWAHALEQLAVYDGYRALFAPLGWTDDYQLFGASASVSFALLAFALRPVTASLGPTGQVTFGVLLASAPLTIASYLARDWPEPWGYLWGTEAIALLLIGLLAIGCAVAGLRRGARPVWAALLAGVLVLPLIVAGAVLFGYYPHGPLVLGGLFAAALVAAGRRAPLPVPGRGRGMRRSR